MALRDRLLGLGNADLSLSFQFDDVTNLVTSATLTNNNRYTVKLTCDAADGTRLANGITFVPSQARTVAIPTIRRWLLDTAGPALINIAMYSA